MTQSRVDVDSGRLSAPLIVALLLNWLQRKQFEGIAYLRQENLILKAQLGVGAPTAAADQSAVSVRRV
jgi:hypothetical protein